MDFVIIGEDALLEDSNVNLNSSAVVFNNNSKLCCISSVCSVVLRMVNVMICFSKAGKCVSFRACPKVVQLGM
jgi:hypothetical protein